MSDILKGKLGWKGERGYSAYEIAVQNGYEGTEQDWLATLGTSSHFDEYYALYKFSGRKRNSRSCNLRYNAVRKMRHSDNLYGTGSFYGCNSSCRWNSRQTLCTS